MEKSLDNINIAIDKSQNVILKKRVREKEGRTTHALRIYFTAD